MRCVCDRTGSWWAFQTLGVKPDILTSAKGIANGLPLGACIADEPYASAYSPGDHGTTFGGGAVVCAAALATFDEIERQGLLADARRKGELFAELLQTIDEVQEVRGAGLMRGAVLKKPVAFSVVSTGLERGLVLNATSDTVLRFVPPLVISDGALVEAVAILKGVLADLSQSDVPRVQASVGASW